MWEHAHGDHPDYKFPVRIEYVGPIECGDVEEYEKICGVKGDETALRDFRSEIHALIYSDGTVAVTIYEYCYSMWLVRDGRCLLAWGGAEENWKIEQMSLTKVREAL